jgi:hypothetical protein
VVDIAGFTEREGPQVWEEDQKSEKLQEGRGGCERGKK